MERNSREGSPASGVTAKSQSTVPIPQRIESMIDPAVWGNWAIDLTNASPQQLGSYMGFLLETYEKRNLTGLELWNEVSPDFADWSEEDFQNVPPPILRFFRDHLIGNGVYVEMDGKKISKNVALALKKEEFHYWSPQELEQGVKRYRNLKALIKDPEFHEEITRPATVANSTGGRVEPTLQPPPPQEQQQWQLPYRPPHPTVSPLTDFQPYESTDRIGKQLTEFAKLYPDDMKYSGDMYDVLEKKMPVFVDHCRMLGIHTSQYNRALPLILKGIAKTYFYASIKVINPQPNFETMINQLKSHFETRERQQAYVTQWNTTTLPQIIRDNPGKTKSECFDILCDKLSKIQPGLPQQDHNDRSLHTQLLHACRDIPECAMALFVPAETYEGLRSQLISSIETATRLNQQQFNTVANPPEQYWTDRTFNGRGRYSRYSRSSRSRSSRGRSRDRPLLPPTPKKCYVCGKPNCWSTKHTTEERRKAYEKFKTTQYAQDTSLPAYGQFLVQYEGFDGLDLQPTAEDPQQYYHVTEQTSESDEEEETGSDSQFQVTAYFTTTAIDGNRIATILADQSTRHAITKEDLFRNQPEPKELPSQFTLEGRYSAQNFQGIMPDSGAAGFSTAGHPQFVALQQIYEGITLNTEAAGGVTVKFGDGIPLESIGTTKVPTPFGSVKFHVIETNTPFLMCLGDMDRLKVYFNNVTNTLIQGNKVVPIIRKWGHPWLLLDKEKPLAWNHLTDAELRRVHRRFGHPSVQRLHKVLQRAGHPVEITAIEQLSKVCHRCQMHAPAPSRFKFTLRDDYEFNYEVIADVMYLEGNRPVLHVVDTATAFNAARFLEDISAKATWEALRLCWIDVYQGPPDWLVTDAGTNFRSTEFRNAARGMAIEIKEIPIEAHNSIGKVERYHTPLRRAYEIIRAEDPTITPESALQTAVKAVNDTAGPNGIVPTLLVFGSYPRITDDSPPSPEVTRRAKAIKKATSEVRELHARRQVAEAIATRNGPDTGPIVNLPLRSQVRVWREKKGWTGPFTLAAINGETCTVDTPRGPKTFRSTVVKPYYEDPDQPPNSIAAPEEEEPEAEIPQQEVVRDEIIVAGGGSEPDEPQEAPEPPRRRPGRPRKRPLPIAHFTEEFNDDPDYQQIFLSIKEQADEELAIKLRREGVITTPGEPFEQSTKQEINSLIARGVFKFTQFNKRRHQNVRIFRSRIVNEVKGKTTEPYEKSRLVIQGYADDSKKAILTQSPTIQRASQRLILSITPSLLREGKQLWLRDITQAYVQSSTRLNRTILAYPPKQIQDQYPKGTIMEVVKPLYGIAEAGTHWWATYHKHHRENLQMVTSSYDPCLLISSTENPHFGCIGMQTDDTLGLSDKAFSQLEDEQLEKAAFTAKAKNILTIDEPLQFNGGIIALSTDNSINLRQKGQAKKLRCIETTEPNPKQQYVEQRARGAYIASICQPEACFDLSTAAQHQDPSPEAIKALDQRIRWQMESPNRGITFIPLDLTTAKLFVFVDGSFANNHDLSSQLGFLIILANDTSSDSNNGEFTIHGNLVHYSSTKSKRVTRSVLASEIYGMVAGVDMAYALATTLATITDHLNLPTIQTVVCTDSYSLYECLVKLGTTKEKRLMIDIMALRQSYERRELQEIRWINGEDNPADALTKSKPNRALERFVDSNTITIRMEGWVTRP
ncbi:uncharacterized protein CTRU02_215366 [Colletotrichum truncatum]|uniref:Uncharacterized protein n=1 Tax=Colletotrichum truncatum TaxID=5467 RepID=A0ACC3YCZ6_COLTU